MNPFRLLASIVAGAASLAAASSASALCLEDPYGNRYKIEYRREHGTYEGTLKRSDGDRCGTADWVILGNGKASPGRTLTLVATNPAPVNHDCRRSFMVSGEFPNLSFYYPGVGYSEGEDGVWSACGATASGAPPAIRGRNAVR